MEAKIHMTYTLHYIKIAKGNNALLQVSVIQLDGCIDFTKFSNDMALSLKYIVIHMCIHTRFLIRELKLLHVHVQPRFFELLK